MKPVGCETTTRQVGRRRSRLVCLTSVIAILISGCTAAPPAAKSRRLIAPNFRADLATYALPLDAYKPNELRQEYAQNIYLSTCMEQHKIPWPTLNPYSMRPPVFNDDQRRLFNLSIATRYGYGVGPALKDVTRPRVASAAQQVIFDSCARSSLRYLMIGRQDDLDIEKLGLTAYSRAQQAQPVRKAIASWSTCMRPLRLKDLPSSPVDMPTASQRVEFKKSEKYPSSGSSPSSLEIMQARLDASCRDSSGYSKSVYIAEVQQEEIAIRVNVPLAIRALKLRNLQLARERRVITLFRGK